VATRVEVLRNGRRGAQVFGALRDATAPPDASNVAVTAVFTDLMLDGLSPLRRPAVFGAPPEVTPVVQRPDSVLDYPLGFLDNTEWQVAATDTAGADDTGGLLRGSRCGSGSPTRRRLPVGRGIRRSSRFPATRWARRWCQRSATELAPSAASRSRSRCICSARRGTWIGIDSTCTNVGNGLANGVLHLWSETGEHIATVTQTAMLRSLG
jgi:hypothetical protein